MKNVTAIIGIELDHEECEILYKAEELLVAMEDKLSTIRVCYLQEGDEYNLVHKAFESLNAVTCRFNVHVEMENE